MMPFEALRMRKAASSWTATLTVPSGKVASNLTNYPLYIDLDDMPSQFWANTNKGKDLRASVSGTQIPVDVVWCSTAEGKGAAFVKVPTLFAASATAITLYGNGTDDRAADASAYGRNAVWSDYESVFLFGITAGDDRTGKTQASIVGDPDLFEKIETSTSDVDSHQGVCWDGTHYYTADTNAIYKWNSSWALVASNTNPIGSAGISGSPAINHCGDLDVYNGLLYVPMECWPASGGLYNGHIGVFRASDLSFVQSFDIHAQAHESASIAYCPVDGLLYVCDFDANTDKLWKYNPSTGAYVGQLTMDHTISQPQGLTWWQDYFWISQDANDETIRVSYAGVTTVGNLPGGSGGIGFGQGVGDNYEGIGHRDDALLQLFDPSAGSVQRVEAWRPYRLGKSAQGGFNITSAGGTIETGSRSSYQTYTMAVTLNIGAKAQNRCALSYVNSAALASANTRQVIAYRNSTTTLAIWDVNNSWLECSPALNPAIGTNYRVHAVYQGTTARRIYVDGTQRNSQSGITAVPSTLNKLLIGGEDADYAELWQGQLGFAYLRPSVLSADWIAGEHSNLNAPSSFYSIA
ncbi:MAG TPA: LamG-like jellyroll fold domain-containing protein [Xanthobacteraceae bacterium]|nr:LamG-like jellyroll fold domain-containing protein [Xanthobacteraceae bacterium]